MKRFSVKSDNIRVDLLETNTGQIRGVPSNPRFIRDKRFEALKQSIADDPEMMNLRELIVYQLYDGKFVIIGGNMRFRAGKELGILSFPCKIIPSGTSPEKMRAFVIKDNVAFGQDNADFLAEDWNLDELRRFGMEDLKGELDSLSADGLSDDDTESGEEEGEDGIKDFGDENARKRAENDDGDASDGMGNEDGVPDILFPSNNEHDIPVLDLDMQAQCVEAPCFAFGYKKGWLQDARTLHFYIDDWRFAKKLWVNPNLVLGGGIRQIVEPNYSLYLEMPRAFGLFSIYKKRWISRYWQSRGLRVFVDLNVSQKFDEANLIGVPKGWNAFFSRGYSDNYKIDIPRHIETARRISGKKNPFLAIYGGGKKVEAFCKENELLFIEEIHNHDVYSGKKESEKNDN